MKLLLIQPSRLGPNGKIEKRNKLFVRGLVLPLLSALTPPDIDVEIVDDRVEDIPFDRHYDLVGITALTSQATRAYQIADRFREKGKRVVMGGFHVTAMPDEAIQHCDAVVLGEAENVWETVLDDAQSGSLKQFYRADKFHDLKNLPMPRFDLLNGKEFGFPFVPVQASRGCPHNCDFCSVSNFYGKSYRHRPVEDVIENIKASGSTRITFVDDNITANKRYARELFKALIPLKIKWIGQSTVNLGRDPELCRLAAESGCLFMGIGIESVDQENLINLEKSWNKVKDFPKLLNVIRKHGIGLVLNMIVGLDHDKTSVFDNTLRFLMQNKTFYLVLNTPIPYPGTKLYLNLKEEGRLVSSDWAEYRQGSVVFSPKRITTAELKSGYWDLLDNFFTYSSIIKRAFYQPLKNMPFYMKRNIDLRLAVKRRDY